jgi:hypothetical protein
MYKGFKLYKEHLNAQFRDNYRGVSINGIELVLLDSETAGCIDLYFGRNGTLNKLESEKQEILSKCRNDLSIVVKGLDGYAKVYFQRLKQIADFILSEVQKN